MISLFWVEERLSDSADSMTTSLAYGRKAGEDCEERKQQAPCCIGEKTLKCSPNTCGRTIKNWTRTTRSLHAPCMVAEWRLRRGGVIVTFRLSICHHSFSIRPRASPTALSGHRPSCRLEPSRALTWQA